MCKFAVVAADVTLTVLYVLKVVRLLVNVFRFAVQECFCNTIISGSSVPDSGSTTMEYTIYACSLFSLQSIPLFFLELKDLYSVFYLVFLML